MATKEEARRELARRELARRRGETAQAPSAVGDVAASASSGFGRGAMDLVGLPGTIGDALSSGAGWLARGGYELATGEAPSTDGGFVERLFAGPSPEAQAAMPFGGRNPLSGDVLREGLSAATGGASDYQPQTTAGEYARTVGEFAPGAVAFGGANVANLLRAGVAPAVASEAAGQLTEGSEAEPYARIVGALAGGAGANRVGRPATQKLPTAKDIKQSAGYDTLKAPMKQAVVTPPTYQGIVRDLLDEAENFGLTTKLKSQFGGVLNDFTQRAATQGASLYDLELLRRSLRNAGGDKLDDAAQALSGKLIERLDDAVDQLSAANIAASGQPGTPVVDLLKEARQTYRIGKKSEVIEEAMNRAKNTASGFENGLRIEFRKILNNPKRAKQFSEAERQGMEGVVRGTLKSNALRWLGGFGVPTDNGRNFLGSVIGMGTGGTIGSLLGPAGAAIGGPALVGVGTLAKAGANAATRNQAEIVEALVKGGPAAVQSYSQSLSAAQTANRESVLRALLQSLQAGEAGQVPLAQQAQPL